MNRIALTMLLGLWLASALGRAAEPNTDKPKATAQPDSLRRAIVDGSSARLSFEEGVLGLKWGYIDSSGKVRIPGSFEEAEDFHDGLAAVKVKGKFGYIDVKGNLAIPARYDQVRSFSEGIAAVCMEHKLPLGLTSPKWGFIDRTGKVVVELKYDEVLDFSEGIGEVFTGWGMGSSTGHYVDRTGRIILDKPDFIITRPFSSGLAFVAGFYVKNKRFIRPDGSVAFSVDQYSAVSGFHDGLARICEDNKYGYLNTKGEIAIKPQYAEATSMHEGLAAVKIGERWGFIDQAGKITIKPQYNRLDSWGFFSLLDLHYSMDSRRIFGPLLLRRIRAGKHSRLDRVHRQIGNSHPCRDAGHSVRPV